MASDLTIAAPGPRRCGVTGTAARTMTLRPQRLDRGRSIRLDQGGTTMAARARQSGPGGPATALGALANAALKPQPCPQ